VSIINPAQIKAFRQVQLRRTKTDGVDAQVILAYAQSQQPPTWQPGSLVQEELTALVKEADRLRRLLKQSLNRREHSDGVPGVVKTAERVLQGCLRKQIAVIEQAISDLCASDKQLCEQVELLCTIPGVGAKSATQILCYGGMALQKRSARELTAHAGLAPQHRFSGSSVRGRSRLCKQGDRRLRTALYMPTLVAVRANPLLRQTYERLVKRGKAKKLALAACMRKLLMIIRAMIQNKCAFNPNWTLT
jgi:transposase